MKFKEMSWKELREDFERVLSGFSVEELVESLREDVIINESYSYEIPTDNNLDEKYQFAEVIIEKKKVSININNDNEEKVIVNENINWEVAA